MSDSDEMTTGKRLLVGGAIAVIALAIGLVYRYSRGPVIPDIPSVGDKGQLLLEATGPGMPSAEDPSRGGSSPSAPKQPLGGPREEEPQTIKGRLGTESSSAQ